ncbi:long-chain-fatty-acid--CoA ligase LcfB (plasmid) [Cupriavidus necator N-1]|uniref:Long-chain-fatty-acid--CoA ligase LcfB n=1 Tax=Cupriavidus necator (strain ATCC 43291 / DSM 13513 / CCUG 52238 / LMG 8453 / N-1) TaxID=1042878 RepID=F8GU89_CUPNN|nr:long-chain fatty acid--CoA ligase [Cupriavidus necator]AEI82293.1 long-chain-fatty-acid--CoA ligase LcfB [Cupriavidus necator N-1]MDX6007310.1 long-chain fatty acid--CoA ligase [Cupriavidus necator]
MTQLPSTAVGQPRRSPFWPPGLPAEATVPRTSLVYNVEVAAHRYPDKPAIRYFSSAISYAALLGQIERMAGYLQRQCGIAPGDRVLLYSQNCPQFIIAYYAILRADAIVVPANPMWLTAELEHVVADSGARVAFAAAELYERLAPLHGDGLQHVIVHDYADMLPDEGECDGSPAVPAWLRERTSLAGLIPAGGTLVRWQDADAAGLAPLPHAAGFDTLCMLAYTSGTTGHPKGCMHTHGTLMSAAVGSQAWRGNTPNAVFLAVAPMFHLLGMQNGIHAPLYLGATIVLLPRWDPLLAADLIERYRVSNWNAPPAMLVDIFSQPSILERDLTCLAFLGGGGAAMPDAVANMLQERFGLNYIEAYGMTETAAFLLSNPRHRPKRECLGIATFGVDARVIDPKSCVELPQGELGEIVASGAQIMRGYWRNPEADAESFIKIDGKRFFRTGDLGYIDEDGYFFMRDRLKRMINASGFKVWPAEVENLLYGHPAIHEACVIAARDERRGETVKAVVTLKPGMQGREEAGAEQIMQWCRERLAAYKVPRIVEFVEALPKSATGKVQWRALQDAESAAHRSGSTV